MRSVKRQDRAYSFPHRQHYDAVALLILGPSSTRSFCRHPLQPVDVSCPKNRPLKHGTRIPWHSTKKRIVVLVVYNYQFIAVQKQLGIPLVLQGQTIAVPAAGCIRNESGARLETGCQGAARCKGE